MGICWHRGAEKLLQGESAEAAFRAASEEFETFELSTFWREWLYAAFLAWERAKRDEFFDRWEVVSIEDEFEIPVSPNVTFYTRADAVVRDRGDNSYWSLNWKTSSDVKDWNRKWFFDPQGWSESIAAEAKLGVEVKGCYYLGIWKGPMYQGSSTSRLLYGYKHFGKAGVTYGTETGGGSVRFEAWKEKFPFGEGTPAWLSFLPKDFLSKHFVESAPQIRQDEVVSEWLSQIVRLENDTEYILSEGSEEDKASFFYQRFSDQTCGRCPFKAICLRQATPQALVSDGFLKPRRMTPRDEAAARGESEDA